MSSLTLAIPDDLKAKMKHFPEINWSEVARQAIAEKTRILEQMQRLVAKSTLSEADTLAMGRAIKRRVWQKHRRAG